MKAGAIAGILGPLSNLGELKGEPAIRPSFDLRPSNEYGEAVLSRIFLISFGDGNAPCREYDLGGYIGLESCSPRVDGLVFWLSARGVWLNVPWAGGVGDVRLARRSLNWSNMPPKSSLPKSVVGKSMGASRESCFEGTAVLA